jgi:glycosyltransferase involved in cell wall biosynthesis
VEVSLLTTPEFKPRPQDRYELLPQLRPRQTFGPTASRKSTRLTTVRQILADVRELSACVAQSKCRHVLFGSYAEYLAPLWAWRLRRLAREDVVFGAVVHDPVRDFVVGPLWWHRRSISSAYSFLREAFVHEPVDLDTIRPMPQLRTTVIPCGPFRFPPPSKSREIMRKELEIPADEQVLLSFGHIRDGKNLDLVLKALKQFPRAFLVVAGKEQSQGQKAAGYYQALAGQLGVANRCRWVVRFLAEEEIGNFFSAADKVLLTYSAKFRSASGVLNAAVHFRKPCLASSGQGNLQAVVRNYGLGVWVEPDSEEAIAHGLRDLLQKPPTPDWERYEKENSWSRNAQLVIERMFGT